MQKSEDDEVERVIQRIVERVRTTKVRIDPGTYARIQEREQGTGSFIDRLMVAAGCWNA